MGFVKNLGYCMRVLCAYKRAYVRVCLYMYVRAYICVCVCACVRAACVYTLVRACVRALRAFVSDANVFGKILNS